jgi:hypothetical protein
MIIWTQVKCIGDPDSYLGLCKGVSLHTFAHAINLLSLSFCAMIQVQVLHPLTSFCDVVSLLEHCILPSEYKWGTFSTAVVLLLEHCMLLSKYKWGTMSNFLVLFFKYGVVKVKIFMHSWCYYNLLAAEYYILTAGYWRRGLVDARWKHNVINYMVMWF